MDIDKHGPTTIRSALFCLLDLMQGGGLPLDAWEARLVQMLSTQARYSNREIKAVLRTVEKYSINGQFSDALARRKAANSETNAERVLKNCRSYQGNTGKLAGCFWCVVCNQGQTLHYHCNKKGKFTVICETANCIRLYEEIALLHKHELRFVNILPQGIGTFIVESESSPGEFHAVDALEQTCSCESFRYRLNQSCKHLGEVNCTVYILRCF